MAVFKSFLKKGRNFVPAAITHYLQAGQVYPLFLSENSLKKEAFLLGAQGPDFLFCHRIFPWWKGESLSIYGNKIHQEAPAHLFSVMRKYYNEHCEISGLKEYIAGFLCHYCLDRTTHPFINYLASSFHQENSKQNEMIFHHEIESALDVIILRYERGELAVDFNLKQTIPKNIQIFQNVGDLYQELFRELYQKEITVAQIICAFQDARKVFGLLNDKSSLKKIFLQRIEKSWKKGNILSCHIRSMVEDDYDYANISKNDWSYGNITKNDNFFELYNISIEESKCLINQFFAQEDLVAITQNIPF